MSTAPFPAPAPSAPPVLAPVRRAPRHPPRQQDGPNDGPHDGRGSGRHPRNIGPMRGCRRCGARTRGGTPCRAPAVRGRARCRMHGGARRSGAQPGNRNRLVHGFWTRAAVADRRSLREMTGDWEDFVSEAEENGPGAGPIPWALPP